MPTFQGGLRKRDLSSEGAQSVCLRILPFCSLFMSHFLRVTRQAEVRRAGDGVRTGCKQHTCRQASEGVPSELVCLKPACNERRLRVC